MAKKDGDIEELLRKCAKIPISGRKYENCEVVPAARSQFSPDGQAVVHCGRYRIMEPVGEGGVGTVYRAYDTVLSRIVALKMLSPAAMTDKIAVQRFAREAKSAARLRHLHIVSVYDFQKFRDNYFLVMQFIEGCPLSHWMKTRRPNADHTCRIILDILDATGYAHSQGIIHRDLKPGNILLDREERVFITDFGLAKVLGEETKISHTGAVMGTPAYMSLEQARGEALDVRADVYSVGAIFYEMLTGRPPIQGKSVLELFYNLAHEEIPDAASINSEIAAPLANICNKALQKNKERRYRNTAEMARDITAYRANQSVIFWRRRSRVKAGKVYLALAAVTLVAIVSLWRLRSGEGKMSEPPVAEVDPEMSEISPLADPIAPVPQPEIGELEPPPPERGPKGEKRSWIERERKKQIRVLWDRMDADGNGHISRDEWQGTQQGFMRLDADHNGIVSRWEWDSMWPRSDHHRRPFKN